MRIPHLNKKISKRWGYSYNKCKYNWLKHLLLILVPNLAFSLVPHSSIPCDGSFALQNNSASIALPVAVPLNIIVLNPVNKIELDWIHVSDTLVLEDVLV